MAAACFRGHSEAPGRGTQARNMAKLLMKASEKEISA